MTEKFLSNDLLNLEEIDKPFSLYQLPYREFIKHKDVSSSIENRLFNKIIKDKYQLCNSRNPTL